MDFLSKLWGGVKSAGSGLMNLFGGGQQQPSFSTNFLSPQALSQQNMLNFGTSSVTPRMQPQSAFGGIMDMFKKPQNLLGAGSLAIGLLKGFPKTPPLPSSVNNLRTQVQSGGSPLGQLAQGKLTDQLNQNYEPLAQPEIDAALRELERNQVIEEDKVRDLYRNLRPGTDPSTDSSFQRDLATVSDQFSRAKADTLATRTRDTKAIFDQQRTQQIQQAIGASDQQMNQLAQLAQLDINQIMTQLQMDYQQALLFKQTFLNLGASLLSPQPVLNLFTGGQ